MIGAWLEGGRIRIREDLAKPEAGPGEAVVRVRLAGICGTDLELLRGYRPFEGVPGHELVGVVEEGPEAWLRARVVAEINVTCRSREATDPCGPCAAGRPAHCARREVLGMSGRDGAFAEWVRVPVRNLHRVPESVPDEAAVFAEPLAAAFRIPEQIDIADDPRTLVLGPGRLGQLVARVLAGRVSGVEVAGRSEAGLARAREAGLTARAASSIEAGAYDLVVECTGSPAGFETAIDAVRSGGTVILKSTYTNDIPIDASRIVVDEIRLVGSRCGPFGPALSALEDGSIVVLDLIDDRFPLTDVETALARAAEPGVAKVLLAP